MHLRGRKKSSISDLHWVFRLFLRTNREVYQVFFGLGFRVWVEVAQLAASLLGLHGCAYKFYKYRATDSVIRKAQSAEETTGLTTPAHFSHVCQSANIPIVQILQPNLHSKTRSSNPNNPSSHSHTHDYDPRTSHKSITQKHAHPLIC